MVRTKLQGALSAFFNQVPPPVISESDFATIQKEVPEITLDNVPFKLIRDTSEYIIRLRLQRQ